MHTHAHMHPLYLILTFALFSFLVQPRKNVVVRCCRRAIGGITYIMTHIRVCVHVVCEIPHTYNDRNAGQEARALFAELGMCAHAGLRAMNQQFGESGR